MSHPLLKKSNFKLYLPTYSGVSTRNLETGEWERSENKREYLVIVKIDGSRTFSMAGRDDTKLYLKGLLTEPKELPNELEQKAVSAALYDPYRETWINGSFLFDIVMQPPFKVVSKILGNTISGTFTI